MSTDYNKKRLSESAHRITVSLNGVEPVTVTLPHPIVPHTIKTTLSQTHGIIDIVAEKALHDLWPDDGIQPERFRWNAEKLEPWMDNLGHQYLEYHLHFQLSPRDWEDDWSLPSHPARGKTDAWIRLRVIIGDILKLAVEKKDQLRFQLKIDESSETADWYVRAHLPIRTSPLGTPILLLSAVDQRLSERLQREGKLDKDRAKKDLHRIYGHVSEEEKIVIAIPTVEVARLLRYTLRLNSTKIRPNEWQKENLPQGKPTSPCLSTYVGCLYWDDLAINAISPPRFEVGYCAKCWEISRELKWCGRCKSITYCSVKCQLDDWAEHKLSCFKI